MFDTKYINFHSRIFDDFLIGNMSQYEYIQIMKSWIDDLSVMRDMYVLNVNYLFVDGPITINARTAQQRIEKHYSEKILEKFVGKNRRHKKRKWYPILILYPHINPKYRESVHFHGFMLVPRALEFQDTERTRECLNRKWLDMSPSTNLQFSMFSIDKDVEHLLGYSLREGHTRKDVRHTKTTDMLILPKAQSEYSHAAKRGNSCPTILN